MTDGQADQVNALQAIGVAVATINSTTPVFERRQITQDLLSGHPRTRLLYVTPELCQTQTFRRTLQTVHTQGQLIRVAIDEAHCISEWGHDFRPAYKELSWFKTVLSSPSVPITAVTATATPRVRADIISMLEIDSPNLKVFNTPSARPNIHYEVRYLQDYASDPMEPEGFQIGDLLYWLDSIDKRRKARLGQNSPDIPPMSGIIYVSFRKAATALANALVYASEGRVSAVAYHAGLSPDERSSIQAMWTSPRPFPVSEEGQDPDKPPPSFSIIVATTAFGMGIDNPCVRFVVHWTPPKSFESFVQESGRAGRDGRAAASIIYYNTQERERMEDRIKRTAQDVQNRGVKRAASQQNLQAQKGSFRKVVRYCETTHTCRHDMIKELFGDFELEQMSSQASPPSTQKVKLEYASPCDFACDVCKEGSGAVAFRKSRMVPEGAPEDFMDYGMASIMHAMFPRAFPGRFRGGPSLCHEC